MRGTVRCDRIIIWATLLLVLVGMLTVYTASVHVAERSFGGSHFFLKRNAMRAALGFIAMACAYVFDYRRYRQHAKKLIIVAIVMLGLTLIFGEKVRGTRGWISAAWFMVQPSELAKLALVIYMADVLTRKQEELTDLVKGLLPRLVMAGAVVLLIAAQPDYGSALAVAVVALIMLFLGGVRVLHIAGLTGAAGLLGIVAVHKVAHIAERWGVWRSSFDLSLDGLDTHGAGYQIYQSLVALGSGGVLGRGLGASLQRAFIPDPYTDFAFSIWGEELGLLGSLGVVALFVFLMLRGLRVARRAPDLYGTVLAGGLTAMVTTYAVINIGVATALIPTTGLPLPFVSYGGSSLVVNMAAIGILLNVSRRLTPAGTGSARRSRSAA